MLDVVEGVRFFELVYFLGEDVWLFRNLIGTHRADQGFDSTGTEPDHSDSDNVECVSRVLVNGSLVWQV